MPLLDTILASIGQKGRKLSELLGEDAANLNNTVTDGPFDGASPVSDEAWDLSQAIVTDCYQLISVLTPRRMQVLKCAFSASLETAIGIAAHFKIADEIEKHGGKVAIQELADSVGTDSAKLANVLQALTTRHIFMEIELGVFSNNRHSRTLLSGGGAPEMIESYALVSGKAFDGLLPVMKDQDRMHSIDPKKSAFAQAYGVGMGITEWIVQPENGEHLQQLMTGMPWLTETAIRGISNSYDFQRLGDNPTICDMGCADGGIMAYVKSKVPSSHIICQDLAPVLPMARQTMESFHAEAVRNGEIEFIEHDYFTSQATEADIYWMRGVLHDYDDSQCVDILQALAPQLRRNPKARVLINEIVKTNLIIPPGEDRLASATVPRNQSQLLEMTSLMQLHTTAFLAGLERSCQDFSRLFDKAGTLMQRCREVVGRDDLPIEIIDVSKWYINEIVAEHYSRGNIFCLGDAVHRHPPFNGLGSNTCIQDAFNLAWKVKLVEHGLAEPSLLQTYSPERQPVGHGVVTRAKQGIRDHIPVWRELGLLEETPEERMDSLAELSAATPAARERRERLYKAIEGTSHEFHAIGIEMNHRYTGQAVVFRRLLSAVSPDPSAKITSSNWKGEGWMVNIRDSSSTHIQS